MHSEAVFEQLKKFKKLCPNLLAGWPAGSLAGLMHRTKTKVVTPQGLQRKK